MAAKFSVPCLDFFKFYCGDSGAELLCQVEKLFGVRISVDEREVTVMRGGGLEQQVPADTDDTDTDVGADHEAVGRMVEKELKNLFMIDDFERALEITNLAEENGLWSSFAVTETEAALLMLEQNSIARQTGCSAIKVDRLGTVTIFGSKDSINRAISQINVIRSKANALPVVSIGVPQPSASTEIEERTRAAIEKEFSPVTFTFSIPDRAARLIIGRGGHKADEFERQCRCLLDVRTKEKTADNFVPVQLTAASMKLVYVAKESLLAFIDRHIQNRDWPKRVDVRCAGSLTKQIQSTPFPMESVPSPVAISPADSPPLGVQLPFPCFSPPLPPPCFDPGPLYTAMPPQWPGLHHLTFHANEEDAPRLIGRGGINKRRLEERADCTITLRTEEKRNGQFPVDVFCRTQQGCESAKSYILQFLADRPVGYRSSAPPSVSKSTLKGKVELSPTKRRSAGGDVFDDVLLCPSPRSPVVLPHRINSCVSLAPGDNRGWGGISSPCFSTMSSPVKTTSRSSSPIRYHHAGLDSPIWKPLLSEEPAPTSPITFSTRRNSGLSTPFVAGSSFLDRLRDVASASKVDDSRRRSADDDDEPLLRPFSRSVSSKSLEQRENEEQADQL